jgi:hypothetical protein
MSNFLTAVITIKHVSTFVNKVESPYVTTIIFDLIDKCRYVFYGYDGSLRVSIFIRKYKKLFEINFQNPTKKFM